MITIEPFQPRAHVGGGIVDRSLHDTRPTAQERGAHFGNQFLAGVRFRPDEARVILDAIRVSDRPQAEWIRDALLSAARRASAR